MKNMMFAIVALSVGMMSGALAAGPNGEVPHCGDAKVLQVIEKRFDHAFLNKDKISIESISKAHQHRLEKATARSPIARRYCGAVAHMSDGRKRTMWYLIEDGMGLAGMGDNVEFCVSGLDRMKAYGGRCRVLR